MSHINVIKLDTKIKNALLSLPVIEVKNCPTKGVSGSSQAFTVIPQKQKENEVQKS